MKLGEVGVSGGVYVGSSAYTTFFLAMMFSPEWKGVGGQEWWSVTEFAKQS